MLHRAQNRGKLRDLSGTQERARQHDAQEVHEHSAPELAAIVSELARRKGVGFGSGFANRNSRAL